MKHPQNNPHKKVTSSDVAKLAGVSQSAVSKILRGSPQSSFSSETVERVLNAAGQLGYQAPPRKLKTEAAQKARWIGVLCPNITNPHYAAIVQSIEQAAYRAGYQVFTCNTYRDIPSEELALNRFLSMGAAGVIYSFLPNAIDKAEAAAASLPMVIIGDKAEGIGIDTLELDSVKSGNLIAQHLVDLGHRDIAFISTTLNRYNPPRMGRLQGVQEVLARNGLGERLVVSSAEIPMLTELDYLSTEYETGYSLAREVLSSHGVSAFIGVNDMVAYGIVDALRDASLRIPQDYSVCGFDDNFPSKFHGISLTTVDHHMSYKGNNAFDILLKKIMRNERDVVLPQANHSIRVEYTPNLVVRSSTGPARQSH